MQPKKKEQQYIISVMLVISLWIIRESTSALVLQRHHQSLPSAFRKASSGNVTHSLASKITQLFSSSLFLFRSCCQELNMALHFLSSFLQFFIFDFPVPLPQVQTHSFPGPRLSPTTPSVRHKHEMDVTG